MAKLILKWLANAGSALQSPFEPGRDYVRPMPGDGRKDLARISSDMRKVGQDMRKAARAELQRHGK